MTDEKELKDQRVPIMMSASELEALDDWMFKNRLRSRGEAIRRLCQVGISAANSWPTLQKSIDNAIDANHLAVRVFEEDFLVGKFAELDAAQSRRYANAVADSYETLAELSGQKTEFEGEIVPFLKVGITMEQARRNSDERRDALLRRLAKHKAETKE